MSVTDYHQSEVKIINDKKKSNDSFFNRLVMENAS